MSSFLPTFLFGTPKKGSEERAADSPPASPSLRQEPPNRNQKSAEKKTTASGKKTAAAGKKATSPGKKSMTPIRKGKNKGNAKGKLAARLTESSVLAELNNSEGPSARRSSSRKAKSLGAPAEADDEAIQFASQPASTELGALPDDSSQEIVAQTQAQSQAAKEASPELGDAPAIGASTPSAALGDLAEPEETREAGADDEDEEDPYFTFTRLINHRWSGDQIEVQVEWYGSPPTWEPETNLHADVPDTLFRYWQTRGGRPTNPRDPDLFDIFAIRKHNKNKSRLLVEWTGYPPEENCWVSKKVLQDTAPDVVADYWKALSEKKK